MDLWLLGGMMRRRDRDFRRDRYTRLYLNWITNKDLLYNTGNSAQHYVIAQMEGEFLGEWTHAYVWLGPFVIHLHKNKKFNKIKFPCLIYLRRKRQPTPVFLPGKSHEQRSLVGYCPRGRQRIEHDLVTKQQFLIQRDLSLKFLI